MTPAYRSPTAADILHVAENMRQEDVLEVAASHGHTPLQALVYSTTASDRSFTVVYDGEPVAIFGWTEHTEGMTSVWLLGTPALVAPENREVFFAETQRLADTWATTFGSVFNFVDANAHSTRRWLRRLGFTEGEPMPYGVAQLPFVQVTKCVTPLS